ncbi:MAG TPA: SDR family NAD(P)-dependent oxidoreductase [Nitrososphaerales archaeon]|nr:SDR family NAD(P)-dependent oxidoreductase [Nitrososphaerales archaeon]
MSIQIKNRVVTRRVEMDSGCRRFDGKVVLVTGSGRGIGFEIARAFVREGAVLVLNDINKDQLDSALAEISRDSPKSITYLCDISKKEEVKSMVGTIVSKLGRIDILVNNAGIGTPSSFLDIVEEEWDRVMNINLKGTFLVTQQVVGQMVKQRYGRIVMISSLSGKMGGVATGIHYSISKGGMMVMARQVAREFGSFNITANAVAPSFVDTNLLKDLKLENKKEDLAKLNVIQRLATTADVANAVLFLAAEPSSFITGETLSVNGGRYMD